LVCRHALYANITDIAVQEIIMGKSLIKDDRIKLTIEHLLSKFGKNGFKIKDYWEADLQAIGLTDNKEKHLVYFSVHNKRDKEFFVSLEDLTPENEIHYKKVGQFESVNLTELERIIADHLMGEATDAQ
jgi:hypothetical protein